MVRRLRAEFTPDRLRALALALSIGTVGGALFAWIRMPLAWMIGAMCLTTVSALAGAKVRVPVQFRTLMIAVLGIMLGSYFRPGMFDRVGEWAVSLSTLVVYVAAIAALIGLYFRRVARYDRATAYFSAVPGGLAEMIMMGGAMGGDERSIALTHASRILLVVSIIPFWFRWFEGYTPAPGGILVAVGSTVLMLGSGVAVAAVLEAVTGLPMAALVLAFAPGGLAEMCLMALALDIDPAFVSTHHVGRILVVVMLAPAAYKAVERLRVRRAHEREARGD